MWRFCGSFWMGGSGVEDDIVAGFECRCTEIGEELLNKKDKRFLCTCMDVVGEEEEAMTF